MSGFQLDTSGEVPRVAPNGDPVIVAPYVWPDLDPFTQGYVEAMFADDATQDALMDEHGQVHHGFSDFAPETLARIIADCERAASEPPSPLLGRQFWEQRQRAMRADHPPLALTLGEDGKVRFAEEQS